MAKEFELREATMAARRVGGQLEFIAPTPVLEAMSTLTLQLYGYLPHAIHPDDFRGFIAVGEEGSATGAPVIVRFLHTDGSYGRYEVSASNGHFSSRSERYVIVSLSPMVGAG
ncbi:hypothetical protein [Arthrobacter mobilis]|uniref:Uncharacterized protein n=1 Tax=Arthrobacter mobilis TaxID=2724944 RepID=A0A7X6HEE9_9MICC|nr:hypothetical protein [Arthrobacter mobilis]NKX54152.1 hypothetical protein [Arthrobacter mobilis]